MFLGPVEAAEPMAGSCSVAPVGTDQLDLEAAEQLIQLSGGDGAAAADDAGSSESRSADSVKCRTKEKEKEKEAPVESRRSRSAGRVPAAAGKDGNVESEDIKGVDDSVACSATAADVVAKDKVVAVESCRSQRSAGRSSAGKEKDRGGGIVHGEARKRPRFRLLADIYRDTEPGRLPAGGGHRHAVHDPPEDDVRKEKKRAADWVITDSPSMQRQARRDDRFAD